jgi:hypothetical protein
MRMVDVRVQCAVLVKEAGAYPTWRLGPMTLQECSAARFSRPSARAVFAATTACRHASFSSALIHALCRRGR